MKKLCALFFVFTTIMMFTVNIHASAPDEIKALSEMSDEEILLFIDEYKIDIPGGEDNLDLWLDFIKYTIAKVENCGCDEAVYNWPATQLLSDSIENAVREYYGYTTTYSLAIVTDSYALRDSVPVTTTWNEYYRNYNCYTYALWKSDTWRVVGFSEGLSQDYYINNMCPGIEDLKDYVFNDLTDEENGLGYGCVVCSEIQPSSSSIPEGYNVLCLRSGLFDFHFMRLSGTSWYHKPSWTIPLIYKHASPNATVWTNESYYDGAAHSGNVYYDSKIYYFIYNETHLFENSFGGESYHTGSEHYYKILQVCESCGYTTYYWDIRGCNGPPCLEYMSLPVGEVELETE